MTEDRSRARVEALAFGLLALLPLLAYFAYLATKGIPRFSILGDYANLELAVRHALRGKTLLGPYSRFGFSHPGPLYFYLGAPVYALVGGTSTGLFAAAAAINAGAAFTAAATTRVLATRAHAFAVTLGIHAWLAAFGDVCVLPWNPLVVVLPLVAFLVASAFVARGESIATPLAVLFGALVLETHLSTVPTVLVIGAAAAAAFVVGRRRARRPLETRERRHVFAAAAVGIVAALPMLVDQLTAPEGNLGKIARFFANRPEPMKPIASSAKNWTLGTSWLPDRILEGAVANDGWEPAVMGSGPMPATLSKTALHVLVVLVVASAIAAFVAIRRRDATSIALLGMGGTSSLLAIVAMRAIVGVEYSYLVFWTTAGTTVLWIGIASTFASAAVTAITPRVPPLRRPVVATAATAAALVVCLFTGRAAAQLQRGWLAHDTLQAYPFPKLGEVYGALHARLAQTKETPIIHADGAWHVGISMILELDRDHVRARTVERHRWLVGRHVAGPEGASSPLHVYPHTQWHPHPLAKCLEPLVSIEGVTLYTSPRDIETCEPPGSSPTTPVTDR